MTAPQHDLDGNLENDGRWGYLWDAENRLIQMESTVAAVQAGAPYRKLVFHYDAGGRRLAKTVYHGTAAAPVFHSSTRWLYDGWNPISEFSGTTDTGGTITRTKSYTWGPDLSGTPQGAGGVGGLLAVIVHSGFTNSAYYPSYDGNGNIVAWTLEGTPAPVSRREYDAFGNTLVEQGVSPSAYGFSTKLQDVETGLYYYGYRYYDPVTGRWPSRDPIGENGGLNLHAFVVNDGANLMDSLGLHRVVRKGTLKMDEEFSVDNIFDISAKFDLKGNVFWKYVCCDSVTSDKGMGNKYTYIATSTGLTVNASSDIPIEIKKHLKKALGKNKYGKILSGVLDSVALESSANLAVKDGKVAFHYDGCNKGTSNVKVGGVVTADGNISFNVNLNMLKDLKVEGSSTMTAVIKAGGALTGFMGDSTVYVRMKSPSIFARGSWVTKVTGGEGDFKGSDDFSLEFAQEIYSGAGAVNILAFDILGLIDK